MQTRLALTAFTLFATISGCCATHHGCGDCNGCGAASCGPSTECITQHVAKKMAKFREKMARKACRGCPHCNPYYCGETVDVCATAGCGVMVENSYVVEGMPAVSGGCTSCGQHAAPVDMSAPVMQHNPPAVHYYPSPTPTPTHAMPQIQGTPVHPAPIPPVPAIEPVPAPAPAPVPLPAVGAAVPTKAAAMPQQLTYDEFHRLPGVIISGPGAAPASPTTAPAPAQKSASNWVPFQK